MPHQPKKFPSKTTANTSTCSTLEESRLVFALSTCYFVSLWYFTSATSGKSFSIPRWNRGSITFPWIRERPKRNCSSWSNSLCITTTWWRKSRRTDTIWFGIIWKWKTCLVIGGSCLINTPVWWRINRLEINLWCKSEINELAFQHNAFLKFIPFR